MTISIQNVPGMNEEGFVINRTLEMLVIVSAFIDDLVDHLDPIANSG